MKGVCGLRSVARSARSESIFFSPSLSHTETIGSAGFVDFQSKTLEKLSATRHRLLWLCWLRFLFSAAALDKPSEGPARLPNCLGQRTGRTPGGHREPNKVQITRGVSKEEADLELHFHPAAE